MINLTKKIKYLFQFIAILFLFSLFKLLGLRTQDYLPVKFLFFVVLFLGQMLKL